MHEYENEYGYSVEYLSQVYGITMEYSDNL